MKQEKKLREVEGWIKPVAGMMKFNVDGAAQGCPPEAGIGDALRDERGHVKILFSKSIGMGDANLAEIRTIREAFIHFIASKWNSSHSLSIESDSRNAIK